jgi:hypothetical protein
MELSGFSQEDLATIRAREERLLLELQAGLDEETIARHERIYTECAAAELPRTAALLKVQLLALARLTADVLGAAEFLEAENDHLRSELEALKGKAAEQA